MHCLTHVEYWRLPVQVAADGAASTVRQAAGIGTWGWDYQQRAVVATIRTSSDHSTAFQRFLPTGPLAVLPLSNGLSSIVWSTSTAQAQHLCSMPEDEFLHELNCALGFKLADSAAGAPSTYVHERAVASNPLSFQHASETRSFGAFGSPASRSPAGSLWTTVNSVAGALCTSVIAASGAMDGFRAPPSVAAVESIRASFPLRLQGANSLTAPHVAIVGDAAHTMHPLAGQNLNFGLADVSSLTASVLKAQASGGAVGGTMMLEDYARSRTAANAAMMLALDSVKRLYAAPPSPLSWLRNIGMAGINALPPVKAAIASIAMGKDGADAVRKLLKNAPAGAAAAAGAARSVLQHSPPLQQAKAAVAQGTSLLTDVLDGAQRAATRHGK